MPRLTLPLLVVALAGAGAAPNVVFIVADDLGFGDLGFTGVSNINTPHIDAIAASGIRLTHYYGQPVCSPSRAAIMTGRYPIALGLQTYVIDPDGVDYGLPLNETTIAQVLKQYGNYTTAAVGKWHLGMASWKQTPAYRGFSSYRGMLSGGQDYFTHFDDGTSGYDMHIQSTPNCGPGCSTVDWASAGEYSTHIYTSSATRVIQAHDPANGPLFLYLAYQAVHSPDQVPASYVWPYNATIPDPKRRTFAGMLSCLDEGVGNVTAAIAASAIANNTLVVFIADNGGPIHCGTNTCGDATGSSNYPLRGGKHSLFEGGVRLSAIVSGPMLMRPSGAPNFNLSASDSGGGESSSNSSSTGMMHHGSVKSGVGVVNSTGMMHHSDWFPTLLEAAGIAYTSPPGFELHGVSAWGMLTRGEPSKRNETLLNIDPAQPAVDNMVPPGQGNAGLVTAEGWKLLLGMPGPPEAWSPPNASTAAQRWRWDAAADAAGTTAGGAAAAATSGCSGVGSVNCSVSGFVPGTCLPGNDLPGSPTTLSTPSACCALCATTPFCVAWTYRVTEAACYVKSSGPSPQRPLHNTSDCVSSSAAWPPLRMWPLGNMTAQLFNLSVDPWERNDVSRDHPDVVEALTQRIAVWAGRAHVPFWWTNSTVNPAANPKLHNNTYVPWLD